MEQGIFELLGEGFLKQDKMDYVSKKNILLCETCVSCTPSLLKFIIQENGFERFGIRKSRNTNRQATIQL